MSSIPSHPSATLSSAPPLDIFVGSSSSGPFRNFKILSRVIEFVGPPNLSREKVITVLERFQNSKNIVGLKDKWMRIYFLSEQYKMTCVWNRVCRGFNQAELLVFKRGKEIEIC